MKKMLFFFIFCFLGSFTVHMSAQGSEQFQTAMKANLALLDSAKTDGALIQLANTFERIAGAESKEWLPNYYAAYCYSMSVFMTTDKKDIDQYMDKADALLNKADSLNPNNSEVVTLKGLVCVGRIMVNPMARGKKYGPISNDYYEKAKKLDDSNPRPYFLQGQSAFHTPKMFGGGKDKAKAFLEIAVVKYKTFKPASAIAPHWGEIPAIDLLKQCD